MQALLLLSLNENVHKKDAKCHSSVPRIYAICTLTRQRTDKNVLKTRGMKLQKSRIRIRHLPWKTGSVGCGLSVCRHAGQHLLPPYEKKGCSQPVSRVLYCTWSAASVIYLRWTSPPTSIVLPSGACRPRHSDGPPSDAGIRGLSSSEVHSTTVTSRLVSSCLTFSPLPP